MQNIFNAVLNTLFVSIPEETVWVVFVLILLKRKDLLDIYFWKENLKKIMIPVIPIAISINLMRYVLHFDNTLNFAIVEIMMCSLVILLIKNNNFLQEKINYIKIIFYVLIVDVIMNFTIECLYIMMLNTFTNLNIIIINNDVYMNILFSIFPRILQITIIGFFLYKDNVDSSIRFFELILKDKILSISLIVFISTLITIVYFVTRVILENHVFMKYEIIYQVIMNILITLIPIILTVSYILPIYHILAVNVKTKKSMENMFCDDF